MQFLEFMLSIKSLKQTTMMQCNRRMLCKESLAIFYDCCGNYLVLITIDSVLLATSESISV